MKTYRHPDTKEIRTVADDADVQIAALEKLGYVAITGEDIASEPSLSVTYQTVSKATVPAEPPALPHLATPIPPGPTKDTSPTAPPTAFSIKGDTSSTGFEPKK